MILSLRDIFSSITPANLQKIPIVRIVQDIFTKTIEENSRVSQRITAIFEIDPDAGDPPGIKRAKENLKNALYTTYIATLWKYVQAVASDRELRESLERYGYTEAAIYNDVNTLINSEFIQAHHEFTQRVGTESAIRYMYQLARYLEQGVMEDDMALNKVNPFVLNYQGKLGRRMYNEFTKPLTHPVSWIDFYETVFQLILDDYFGVEIEDAYTYIEINCDDKYVVFIADEDFDGVTRMFQERLNPRTMQPFTPDDVKNQVSVIPNKVVATYRKFMDEDENVINVFIFDDKTVFWHNETWPRKSYYSTYADYLIGFKQPLLEWGACWLLRFKQQTNFKFLYWDYCDFFKDFYISMIKEESGGLAAPSCYNSLDPKGMFKVCGHEMLYVPGVDTSRNEVHEIDKIKEFATKKFVADIDYRLCSTSDIFLEDKFGNKISWKGLKKGTGSVRLNTHGLSGNEYTVWIDDHVFPIYKIEATGLNNFKRKCQIRSCYLWFGQCVMKGIIQTDDYKIKTKRLTWDMMQTKAVRSSDYWLEFIWDIDGITDKRFLDISKDDSYQFEFSFVTNQTQRKFGLTINHYKSTGRLIKTEYYRGSNLNLYNVYLPNISGLRYQFSWDNWDNVVDLVYNIKPLENIKDMPFFDDYPPEATARIGEKVDGTFYPPYQKLEDVEDTTGMRVDGSLVQGITYEDSFWLKQPYESTFIYLGFEQECYDTSDVYLINSPEFVTDGDWGADGNEDDSDGGIIIDSEGKKGNYLFTTISPDLGNDPGSYLFTEDGFYLFTTTATYEEQFVTVTCVLDGGEGWETVKIKRGNTFLYARNQLGFPIKNGYVFHHWSLEKDGEEIPFIYQFYDDVTIYANYAGQPITITAESGKGHFE